LLISGLPDWGFLNMQSQIPVFNRWVFSSSVLTIGFNLKIRKSQNHKFLRMRFVKLAIISAVVLFVVIFLFSLIIPSTVRVSRAIDISAPKDSLVAQLADLRQWKNWNVMTMNSGFTWHGTDGQLVVQWYFDINLRWYPWEKFGSIVFDKQLGPPMEKSLGNLKKLLEKNP
jgi:hypothetical protein